LTLRYAHVRLLCTLLALLPASTLTNANVGASTFKEVCAVCHGPTGEGTKSGPQAAPPLKGSAFVKSATPDELKSLIKFGRTGANKKFKDIPQGMPAQALSEAEMTDIIPYIQVELQK
jgi:mono/diheme cytochrome c family protein